MAIESSKDKKAPAPARLVSETPKPREDTHENSLRPKTLREYVGQTAIKSHLQVVLDSAKIRKTPVEHILFY